MRVRVQSATGGIPVGDQFCCGQGLLPRQPLHQALLEGGAQGGFGHPGEGIGVEQKDQFHLPAHAIHAQDRLRRPAPCRQEGSSSGSWIVNGIVGESITHLFVGFRLLILR